MTVKSTIPSVLEEEAEFEKKHKIYIRFIRRYLNTHEFFKREELTVELLIEIAAMHLKSSIELHREYMEKAIYAGIDMQKTYHAKNAVRKKLKNDPKQKALKEIQRHYDSNKFQFKRRGYSAQFVKQMGDKYPIIESHKTIERLVAKLNKINKYPVI